MVPDASGAVEPLLNAPAGKRRAARLEDDAEVVHVPHPIDVEIAQVLRRYAQQKTLDERSGMTALRYWRDFDVERHPHEPFLDRIWRLRANVTAYDAIYLALAEALSMALVTGDRKPVAVPRLAVAVEPL